MLLCIIVYISLALTDKVCLFIEIIARSLFLLLHVIMLLLSDNVNWM